jgi:hypothetical protein
MERSKFSFRYGLIASILSTTLLWTPLAISQDESQNHVEEVSVNSNGKEIVPVEFTQVESSPERIARFMPSRHWDMEQINGLSKTSGEIPGLGLKVPKFGVNLATESALFGVSLGVQACAEVIFIDNDPAACQHWVDQQFHSVSGYANFAGFMAGNAGVSTLFRVTKMTVDTQLLANHLYDEAKSNPGLARALTTESARNPELKRAFGNVNRNFADLQSRLMQASRTNPILQIELMNAGQRDPVLQNLLLGPTESQAKWARLAGPYGMIAGMALSTAMGEVMADPNMKKCAVGIAHQVKQDYDQAKKSYGISIVNPNAVNPLDAETEHACDAAYRDWAISKKILDYAPDIAGMLATQYSMGLLPSVMRGYIERQGEAGAKKVLVRVIGFVLEVGESGTIVGRFALGVANMVTFLELSKLFTATPKRAVSELRQYYDLHLDYDQSTGKIWKAFDRAQNAGWTKSNAGRVCNWANSFKQSRLGHILYLVSKEGEVLAKSLDKDCFMKGDDLSEILVYHAETQKKWRDTIMSAAMAAHSGWKDYAVQVTNTYLAAHDFYLSLLTFIQDARKLNDKTHQATNPFETRPAAPFSSYPFGGQFAPLEFTDNAPAWGIPQSEIHKAYDVIGAILADKDRRSTYSKALATEGMLTLVGKKLDEKWQVLNRIHNLLPAAFIDQNWKNMATDATAIDPNYPNLTLEPRTIALKQSIELEVRSRRFAEAFDLLKAQASRYSSQSGMENPFLQVYEILKTAKVYAPGYAWLNEKETDGKFFVPETKDLHPTQIGRYAGTPRMVDYLLTSMICGPKADPSAEEKKAMYVNAKNPGLVEDIWNRTGGALWDRLHPKIRLGQAPNPQNESEMIADNYNEEAAPSQTRIFNDSDTRLVIQHEGFPASFRPPRVIQNLNLDFCNQLPQDALINFQNGTYDAVGMHSPITINDHGQKVTVNSFLDLVIKYVRPDLVADKTSFEKWWGINLEPVAKRTIDQFEVRYREIMKDEFLPALNDPYHTFTFLGHKVKTVYYGAAAPVMRDETYLYLSILAKMIGAQMPSSDSLNDFSNFDRKALSLVNLAAHQDADQQVKSIAEVFENHANTDEDSDDDQKKSDADLKLEQAKAIATDAFKTPMINNHIRSVYLQHLSDTMVRLNLLLALLDPKREAAASPIVKWMTEQYLAQKAADPAYSGDVAIKDPMNPTKLPDSSQARNFYAARELLLKSIENTTQFASAIAGDKQNLSASGVKAAVIETIQKNLAAIVQEANEYYGIKSTLYVDQLDPEVQAAKAARDQ